PPPEHAGPQHREQQHVAVRHLLLCLDVLLCRLEGDEAIRGVRTVRGRRQPVRCKGLRLSSLVGQDLHAQPQMGRQAMTARARSQAIYATIWRWHFYAGLFVIPFVLLLSVTGAAYLFKPQVERWEERAFHGLSVADPVSPETQVNAALAAFPGARFDSYRLPERTGDAAMIHLALPDGHAMRDVFVSPQGEVLGSIAPDARLMEWTKRIHGQ